MIIKKKPIKRGKAKKERSHSIANTQKVAVAVAKNPNWTLHEIAEDAWVSHQTVSNKLWKLWTVKEKWLEDLLSVDIQIVQSATIEINKRINDEEEVKKIKATELSQIAQHSTDRYMKFRWDATDEKGWLNMQRVQTASVEELLQLIKK